MKEKEFTEIIRNYLADKLSGYEVTSKEALLYKIIINHEGGLQPAAPLNPTRGKLAFETDLLIKKNGLPIVVCEVKYKNEGGFTTHDILTYSTKALKHKAVYPYLRYGFIAGNTDVLSNKFFNHNEGFDFALAMPEPDETSLAKLLEIINTQILNAESLLNMLKDKHRTVSFNTRLELKNA
jgi:hypothetical protein